MVLTLVSYLHCDLFKHYGRKNVSTKSKSEFIARRQLLHTILEQTRRETSSTGHLEASLEFPFPSSFHPNVHDIFVTVRLKNAFKFPFTCVSQTFAWYSVWPSYSCTCSFHSKAVLWRNFLLAMFLLQISEMRSNLSVESLGNPLKGFVLVVADEFEITEIYEVTFSILGDHYRLNLTVCFISYLALEYFNFSVTNCDGALILTQSQTRFFYDSILYENDESNRMHKRLDQTWKQTLSKYQNKSKDAFGMGECMDLEKKDVTFLRAGHEKDL